MWSFVCQFLTVFPAFFVEHCAHEVPGIATPIAIALSDERHFRFTSGQVGFDINADGIPEKLPWLASGFAFIGLDLNRNGRIDSAGELFGDATVLVGQNRMARHGYSALSQYDKDSDGKITPADPIFEKLVVWHDTNENGVCDNGELASLAQYQIISLDLRYKPYPAGYQRLPAPLMLGQYTVQGKDGKEVNRLMGDVYFKFLTPR